jgi:hypothetical protein
MERRRLERGLHPTAPTALYCGVALLSLTLVAGCLVTDRLEFGEPNVPANLLSLSPPSLSRLPPAEVTDPRCGEDLVAFQADVTDVNIADALTARLLINGQLSGSFESDIAPTGEVARAPLTQCAPRGAFERACNHVELVVTNRFAGTGPYNVRDPDDIAKLEWWVIGAPENAADALIADCAGLVEDGGVP